MGWKLPEAYAHTVLESDKRTVILSLREQIKALLEKTGFPRVIDLAVGGLLDNRTLILWRPSGQIQPQEIENVWNEERGPFKPLGIMSPKENFQLTEEELKKMALRWTSEP